MSSPGCAAIMLREKPFLVIFKASEATKHNCCGIFQNHGQQHFVGFQILKLEFNPEISHKQWKCISVFWRGMHATVSVTLPEYYTTAADSSRSHPTVGCVHRAQSAYIVELTWKVLVLHGLSFVVEFQKVISKAIHLCTICSCLYWCAKDAKHCMYSICRL